MDSILFFTSCILIFFSLSMIIVYLLLEKGSIFDPIPVSWAGYTVFIALAMLFVSTLEDNHVRQNVRNFACVMTVVASLCYTIGLYAGRGTMIARMIPEPTSTLTKGSIWFLWAISICGLLCTSYLSPYVGAAVARVLDGITLGLIGSATLISLLAVLSLKKSLVTKSVMAISSSLAIILFLRTFFSRRPLLGLAIAVLGYIFLFKISGRGKPARFAFFLLVVLSLLVLTLYLSATRGKRFYGDAIAESGSPLSVDALTALVPGVQINYLAYEFALEQVPRRYGYLYGSGLVPAFLFFVPRALWPDKPVATGYFISQLWFGRPDPPWNLSPLPLGELYLNFGVLGLLLGTFLAGKFVRVTNSYLRIHADNSILWLAWLMIIPDFASEWRGDFTSMSVQAFLRVAVFLGIAWLATRVPLSGTTQFPPLQS